MPDYSKSKIYLIKYEDKIVYIGSTVQKLSQRICKHKNNAKYNKWPDNKFYAFMNKNEFNNFKIELLEEYSCNTKEDLFEREAYYQRKYPDTYNSNNASPTIEEYKAKVSKYNKTSRANRMNDEVKEQERLASAKAYNENKEHRLEIQKRSRDKNKKIYNCECGSQITNNIERHLKTKKHLDFLTNQIV